MSLIAPLLSVPGRVRKLRGNNAPKLPAAESIAPTVTQCENSHWAPLSQSSQTTQISRLRQPHETHFAFLIAQNNAVVLPNEACNITGNGSLHGVWLTYSGYLLSGTTWARFGANIIVDGVELVDQDWEFDTRVYPAGDQSGIVSEGSFNAVSIPLIGTQSFQWDYENGLRVVRRAFVPLLKPLVFDESLVINLVHKESEASPTLVQGLAMRLSAAVYEDA